MKLIPEPINRGVRTVLLLTVILLPVGHCYAQWTAQDSLKLKKLLEKEGEIELNPDAIRSLELGTGGVVTGGSTDAGSALPPTPLRIHDLRFDFDETLPTSPFPYSAADTLMDRLRMTLQPYSGIYLYDLDLMTGHRLSEKRKYNLVPGFQPVPGRGGSASDTRLMMMGGTMGGSFKYDFNRVFSTQFWDFRQRRTTRKTLAALSAYDNPEQQAGRYEYFHIDNEEYRLEFTGNDSLRSSVEEYLRGAHPVEEGLLYFRYTEMCWGTFTYFLPDGNDVRGTFTTNGTRYTLCYKDGREDVITLSWTGGRFFMLRRDLTKQYRHVCPVQGVEKVQVVTEVTQIAKGKDR